MIDKVIALVVILITSAIAVLVPVVQTLNANLLFASKHFGSGVILSTGLVHLLQPAVEALEPVSEYPIAYALCLGSILILTLGDGMQRRNGHSHSHGYESVEGEKENDSVGSVLVLESGILFHSVFIGISCAFADSPAMACAIVVHQVFEGIGLGARLSAVKWDKPWKPRACAWLYALATPLGIIIGLTSGASSPTVTGLFDAISSGVLLYTGLVELLANDLMSDLLQSPLSTWLGAYASTVLGAVAMAALAEWI